MSGKMMRINETTRNILRVLATEEGKSMQDVLAKAIENYWQQHFFEKVNMAYAAVRQNPEAWAEIEKERAEWDSALNDGLDSNEEWRKDEQGTVRPGVKR